MTSKLSTPVVVFGAGGLAREVAWVLGISGSQLLSRDRPIKSGIEVVGHLDDRKDVHGTTINDRPILGGIDWVADHPGHAVIVAVGKPTARRAIVGRLREAGATFPTLLAPDFVMGDEVELGEGVIVLPGVVVTCNVYIGDFVLLNPHVSVSHDGKVGEYCSLGPGVNLAGNVHVGNGSDIGTNSSVIPGVRIGSEVVIGAGACVVRNLPDGVTAVGVPARPLSTG